EISIAESGAQHDHQEDFMKNMRDNLFGKPKKFSSKVLKVSPSLGRSFLPSEGVNETHADINLINHTLSHVFQRQRHQSDIETKEEIRKAVLQLFQSFGLKTEVHKFVQHGWINGSYSEYYAKNLIAVLPSDKYGKKGDRIFVIGGHYDTVYRAPGVDDNGSGSTAVLEAARILSKYKGQLSATIYFILFDQEESGLDGSAALISEYLLPKILNKYNATFIGAYITDMVLVYEPAPNKQTLPSDFIEMCPEATEKVHNNSDKGDFVSVWAREADRHLFTTLEKTWDELSAAGGDDDYKIIVFKSPIADNYRDFEHEHRYSTFMRSDHASFWISEKWNKNYKTLPAVLLHDFGPWRGNARNCYHRPCDNMVQLTDQNLHFLAKITNAVVQSTLKFVRKTE
ncbi:hypothetical protein B4U80_12742, partial [Leptotrombidium deliense]